MQNYTLPEFVKLLQKTKNDFIESYVASHIGNYAVEAIKKDPQVINYYKAGPIILRACQLWDKLVIQGPEAALKELLNVQLQTDKKPIHFHCPIIDMVDTSSESIVSELED